MPVGVYTLTNDMVVKGDSFIRTTPAPTEITTAGAATYTAEQVLSGIIIRDPSDASRTDVLPTAALLVAALTEEKIGDTVEVMVVNTADAAETITIDAGTGGGFHASQTAASKIIGQNATKILKIRITGVGSSAAYVVYM